MYAHTMFNRFSHLESFGKCVFRLRVRAEEIESRRLTLRLLLITNRNICLEKCFFGALTSFYARTESWAGFDALECFALLIEAVSGHFPVSRCPQWISLYWPFSIFLGQKFLFGQNKNCEQRETGKCPGTASMSRANDSKASNPAQLSVRA